MSLIHYEKREIRIKVVFYGPAGAGKSAALQFVYSRTGDGSPTQRLGNTRDDGVYYDYLPLRLGDIRGFKTFYDLFTVPGAAEYREARRTILESVDGVVLVADSRPARMQANVDSLEELGLAMRANGFDLPKMPFVLACGHADAPDAVDAATLGASLLRSQPNAASVPVFAMDAIRGAGVFDAVKAIAKLTLTELKKGAG